MRSTTCGQYLLGPTASPSSSLTTATCPPALMALAMKPTASLICVTNAPFTARLYVRVLLSNAARSVGPNAASAFLLNGSKMLEIAQVERYHGNSCDGSSTRRCARCSCHGSKMLGVVPGT